MVPVVAAEADGALVAAATVSLAAEAAAVVVEEGDEEADEAVVAGAEGLGAGHSTANSRISATGVRRNLR